MILNRKNEKGYTLVEAIVAILILSLGILPSLSIVVIANSFSAFIKNNLIATNLAQEGVEVVRAMRDANWFNGQPFDNGLVPPSFDCTTGCRVQWDSASPITLGTNPPLLFDSVSGIYNYLTGVDTIYRRKITITKVAGSCSCELLILAEVTWPERGGRTKTVVVESHLFNWN